MKQKEKIVLAELGRYMAANSSLLEWRRTSDELDFHTEFTLKFDFLNIPVERIDSSYPFGHFSETLKVGGCSMSRRFRKKFDKLLKVALEIKKQSAFDAVIGGAR